jgi:P pilus assembly chaperone PapD
MTSPRFVALALFAGILLAPRPASATFHLMQIEQVIAGVDGSTATQAIQLRMRQASQNFVSQARIKAWDANGANPVLIVDLTTNVGSSAAASRVLIATANFSTATNPAVTPDFIMTNPIPDAYMAAGSLTWEDDFGTIYWRLSWGGAGYTGVTTGSVSNDLDGDYGPAYAGPLPTDSGVALRFQGASNKLSTANSTDYALTAGSAVFTNNAGDAGTIVSLIGVPGSDAPAIALGNPFPNPAHGAMTFFVSVPHTMHVSAAIYDLAGRRVAPLFDGVAPAGRNSYSWDGRDPGGATLASGVYFVGLDAEGTRRSKRFVLVGRGKLEPEPHEE